MAIHKREGQNPKEEALRKYFAKVQPSDSKSGAVALLMIGGAMFLIGVLGLANDSPSMGILLLILGVGFGVIGGMKLSRIDSNYQDRLAEVQPQPSDREVQNWLASGIQRIIDHSRIALNLSEDESTRSEPLVIMTPILTRSQGSDSDWVLWRRGEDSILRFGYYRLIVIRLTERHLGSYVCDYNFVRDVALNERTSEFHYHDVVSVTTEEWSDPGNLPTGKKVTIRQDFVLSVASGESIRVSVDTAQIRQITGEEAPPELGAESAVAQIRSMLRGYKALAAAV